MTSLKDSDPLEYHVNDLIQQVVPTKNPTAWVGLGGLKTFEFAQVCDAA